MELLWMAKFTTVEQKYFGADTRKYEWLGY